MGRSPSPPPPERRASTRREPSFRHELRRFCDRRLADRAVYLEAGRERLVLDPLLVPEELGLVLRDCDHDAVGQLVAFLLAPPVDLVDELPHAAFELERGIEREVERDGEAVLAGDRPALLASTLDQNLVGAELASVDAEAAALELLELPRLEGRAHRAQLLAELWAEHRQVRLDPQLAGLDRAELHPLHAELVGDLVRMGGDGVRTLDDQSAQRLAKLQP